jgi:hypothetical protein
VDEASYVRDKLVRRHPESLLTVLAMHRFAIDELDAPWDLPHDDALRATRDLVTQAERFAVVMQGAAFLYNFMLAEKAKNDDYRERYRTALVEWRPRAAEKCSAWKLEAFWPKVIGHGHSITHPTREFVSEWTSIACQDSFEAATASTARRLVERREMRLKGAQSRFVSLKALQRWGGAAGASLNTYRWRTAKQFLVDLHGAEG